MPIKVVGFNAGPWDQYSADAGGDRFQRNVVLLQFSGNYPTGGDVLDLTNGGGSAAFPSVLPPNASRGLAFADLMIMGPAGSLSAGNGEYRLLLPVALPVPFSSLNNLKLKAFLANGNEYTAGAYAADVLTDIVALELIFAR